MEDRPFQILQINAQKKAEVMHSVINDESLRDFGALLLSEPLVRRDEEGKIRLTPAGHHNQFKIEPTSASTEGRWVYRSMIWTRSDLEAEQVQVESSDITAVIIRLPKHTILLFLVYVQGSDTEALRITIQKISQIINGERSKISALEVIIAGDFNRHDVLWGGTRVSNKRQDEAEPITIIMGEQGLNSLLKSGTITTSQGDDKSTINIVVATQGLTDAVVFCKVHNTNHGSNHVAIRSGFKLQTPARIPSKRLLFKEAPWQQIREITLSLLKASLTATGTQEKYDQLMSIVSQAVQAHTLIARLSPNLKRQWSKELTKLQRAQSSLRN